MRLDGLVEEAVILALVLKRGEEEGAHVIDLFIVQRLGVLGDHAIDGGKDLANALIDLRLLVDGPTPRGGGGLAGAGVAVTLQARLEQERLAVAPRDALGSAGEMTGGVDVGLVQSALGQTCGEPQLRLRETCEALGFLIGDGERVDHSPARETRTYVKSGRDTVLGRWACTLPRPPPACMSPIGALTLNQMVQQFTPLDASFSALSDATRRGVLEQLGRSDASITELADRFHMTLTGMKKHVGVLERAGFVTTQKVGRVRTCRLGLRRLEEEAAWIESYRQVWAARFEALDAVVEHLKREEEDR